MMMAKSMSTSIWVLGIDPASIDPAELKQMDCITCHNRITHLVDPPEDVVDQLMANGIISSDIPEIRTKAIELYSRPYPSVEMGVNGIAGLENYYSTYHPDFYATDKGLRSIKLLLLCKTSTATASFPNKSPIGPPTLTTWGIKIHPAASAAMMASTWIPAVTPSAWSATCAILCPWLLVPKISSPI